MTKIHLNEYGIGNNWIGDPLMLRSRECARIRRIFVGIMWQRYDIIARPKKTKEEKEIEIL